MRRKRGGGVQQLLMLLPNETEINTKSDQNGYAHKKEVVPRFELGLLESKSSVITTTLYNIVLWLSGRL